MFVSMVRYLLSVVSLGNDGSDDPAGILEGPWNASGGSGGGEPDLEPRAASVSAVHRNDVAAVVLDDPARDREPEARAAVRGIGRTPEAVEEMRQILVPD